MRILYIYESEEYLKKDRDAEYLLLRWRPINESAALHGFRVFVLGFHRH